ncbi:MAG: 23S rRNA (pseudouridine(1915)-N(3))-methyltransferase RlmH [Lachnospiraceae bacterium]|nr:23S rRNA (pseudouridine(1915)-N(3))-methyltransferase RlmH [Lachnospiraceae bacterium]
MQITIICVGKIKEKFYKEAVLEYSKRLGRYCKLNIIEVADEMTPDGASDNLKLQIMEKEADRILSKLPADAHVISLEIKGQEYTSEALSSYMESLGISGISHIVFIIGGSLGLHPSVSDRADMHLSFSRMTFPHQLMRVILLEQIYRSYRIMNGEPYHK